MEFAVNTVGAGYFVTMGIPLVRGRGFTSGDRPGAASVVVVNESFARRFWPGQDPIGRRLDGGDGEREVVGVARDGKYWSLTEEPQPHLQSPSHGRLLIELVQNMRSPPAGVKGPF